MSTVLLLLYFTPWYLFILAVDPFFTSLRENPRFQALLERMADSQREQRALARETGALDGYDALIEARQGAKNRQ